MDRPHSESPTDSTTSVTFPPDSGRSFTNKLRRPQALRWARTVLMLLLVLGGGALLLTFNINRSLPTPVAAAPGDKQYGRWDDAQGWPNIVAIHMSLLPNGNVMLFDREKNWFEKPPDFPLYKAGLAEVFVWKPTNEADSSGPGYNWNVPVPSDPGADPTNNIFCTGHAFLPDGKLLLTGGHRTDGEGTAYTNIFDPQGEYDNAGAITWLRDKPMNAGRWYPTNTTLGDGDVLTVGGTMQENVFNNVPQVWRYGSSTWDTLSNQNARTDQNIPFYAWMHLMEDGRVFNSGWNRYTDIFDPRGEGGWNGTGLELNFDRNREYGSSVMYEPNKVLVVGGGGGQAMTPATNSAEVIDLDAPNLQWQYTGAMQYRRRHLNATILPDGAVLATGGTQTLEGDEPCWGETDEPNHAVLDAEVWTPPDRGYGGGAWATLAKMKTARLYHSAAVLLPDGRVVSGGGGMGNDWCGSNSPFPDHANAEIFSPPYLFNDGNELADRPVITNLPGTYEPGVGNYGQSVYVETPNADQIEEVSLVRLGSATHAYDQNQRFYRPSFYSVGSGLNVNVPGNPNEVPPGHYMLFILQRGDNKINPGDPDSPFRLVPSVAKIIRIG